MRDATHDPTLRSWVESANAPDSDFPVQNLPFGAFRRKGSDEPPRIGVAIGEQVLDLKLAREQCPWGPGIDELLAPLADGQLKPLMAAGAAARRMLRSALSLALADGSDQAPFLELCLLPQAQAQMQLPCAIGDYTDFFTGIHHATAVGRLFRPDNPLLPNYKWVPIAYHGRASSIGVSPQAFVRP
jgi:fumarylacetoacetase